MCRWTLSTHLHELICVLEESGARAVVASAQSVVAFGIPCVHIDIAGQHSSAHWLWSSHGTHLKSGICALYVWLYRHAQGCRAHTSSSTVAVTGMHEQYGMDNDTRQLQSTTFTFDVSIHEIFVTLAVGGCVVQAETAGHA